MKPRILSLPVVLTSWALGLSSWALVWWLLPTAQGLGTWAVGGSFIGISVPNWTQPWALVNEPTVGFAATRAALWAYWLAPLALAGLLALLLPHLSLGPSLNAHLLQAHLAFAAGFLGLAWLPGLGEEDGLVAGLARFFHWDANLVWGLSFLLAVFAVRLPVRTLASPLWHLPGGPTVRKKMLLGCLHLLPLALLWMAGASGAAPKLPRLSLTAGGGVLVAAFFWLLASKPPHPLKMRDFSPAGAWLAWALVFLLVLPSSLAFAPRGGRPLAFLWGREELTSNVRPGVVKVPLRRLLFLGEPPATSSPRS